MLHDTWVEVKYRFNMGRLGAWSVFKITDDWNESIPNVLEFQGQISHFEEF